MKDPASRYCLDGTHARWSTSCIEAGKEIPLRTRVALATVIFLNLGLLLATALPASAIRIKLIHYRASTHNDEYVVIYNGSHHKSVELMNWILRGREGHGFDFPPYTLRPGHSLLVRSGRGGDQRRTFYWGSSRYNWRDSGDTATLRRPNGHLVDRCHYPGGETSASC